ncbi:hypothetical protein [Yoonia sp. BS5-3]|uniref:Uncharacterized protein n=1 Tax=Yoonia phaeophyticola TaxID=3137369 RepID=A0ABZ2V795_9RHOB
MDVDICHAPNVDQLFRFSMRITHLIAPLRDLNALLRFLHHMADKWAFASTSNGEVPTEAKELFDGLYAVCQIDAADFIVTAATNPFMEGCQVLSLQQDVVRWNAVGFQGNHFDIEMHTKNGSG